MTIHCSHKRICKCLLIVLIALIAGCGKKLPTLGEVEGTLTLGGKPLDEVRVEFLPDPEKGNIAESSYAETDAQGHFVLSFSGAKKSGAAVGVNRVILHDFKALNSRDNPIPPRFSNSYTIAASTPISKDVQAGKQTINIELNDHPPK